MNTFSITILFVFLINGTSTLFGTFYWATRKTEILAMNIRNFAYCLSHAGTFPGFDTNTVEGMRLDTIRRDMDRLGSCTVWTVAVCGPYNHIKVCYNLMLLLIGRPSLITSLAASPFNCAFKVICFLWSGNPGLTCQNGVPVIQPDVVIVPPPPPMGVYGHPMPPYGSQPYPPDFYGHGTYPYFGPDQQPPMLAYNPPTLSNYNPNVNGGIGPDINNFVPPYGVRPKPFEMIPTSKIPNILPPKKNVPIFDTSSEDFDRLVDQIGANDNKLPYFGVDFGHGLKGTFGSPQQPPMPAYNPPALSNSNPNVNGGVRPGTTNFVPPYGVSPKPVQMIPPSRMPNMSPPKKKGSIFDMSSEGFNRLDVRIGAVDGKPSHFGVDFGHGRNVSIGSSQKSPMPAYYLSNSNPNVNGGVRPGTNNFVPPYGVPPEPFKMIPPSEKPYNSPPKKKGFIFDMSSKDIDDLGDPIGADDGKPPHFVVDFGRGFNGAIGSPQKPPMPAYNPPTASKYNPNVNIDDWPGTNNFVPPYGGSPEPFEMIPPSEKPNIPPPKKKGSIFDMSTKDIDDLGDPIGADDGKPPHFGVDFGHGFNVSIGSPQKPPMPAYNPPTVSNYNSNVNIDDGPGTNNFVPPYGVPPKPFQMIPPSRMPNISPPKKKGSIFDMSSKDIDDLGDPIGVDDDKPSYFDIDFEHEFNVSIGKT